MVVWSLSVWGNIPGCDGGSVGIIGDGRNDRNDSDEQSGALHMFASYVCLAIFVLPTLPWSSLGAWSSCSHIPCLSAIPPLILSFPQLLHMF